MLVFIKKCTSLEESLLHSFFVCEDCQRQSCKAFTCHIYACKKTDHVGRPLLRENLAETVPPLEKRLFAINICP